MAKKSKNKTDLPSGFGALRELHDGGATGILVLRAARFDDLDVYFMDGQVIACSGLSDEWLLGRLIVASGTVPADAIVGAMDRGEGESLVDYLMQNELLSMDSLQGIQADRFRDNIHFACVTPWAGASFSKQDAVFPPDMQLGVDTPALLDEIAGWYERVQPLLVMQHRNQDPVFERVPKSRLGKGEQKMVAQLVKGPSSLSTVLALSPIPRYRTLATLAQLVSKQVLSFTIGDEGDLEKASLTGELEVLSGSLETSDEAIPLSTMEIEPLVAEASGLTSLTGEPSALDSSVTGLPEPEGLEGEEEEEEAFFEDAVVDFDEDAIGEVSSADIAAAEEARRAKEAAEDARIAKLIGRQEGDSPAEAEGDAGEAEEGDKEAIEELDEESIAEVDDDDIAEAELEVSEDGGASADEADAPAAEADAPPPAEDVPEPEAAEDVPEPSADMAADVEVDEESEGGKEIDYEKGNVKVYDVLDKVDLSHVESIPGVEGGEQVPDEVDAGEIAAAEHSIELGEGSMDDDGMVDSELDPELLDPESKVSGPADAPDSGGSPPAEEPSTGSSADLFDSSTDLSASGEVPPIHLSGTDDSVEFFIDEGEDGEAVVRISESSIPAIPEEDPAKLDLPKDIGFSEDELKAFLQRIQVFNRIFRVIFESFSERLGGEATVARFNRFLGDKSLQYPALFEEATTSKDGTLEPTRLIKNLAKAQPQDHEYFLHEGLYDLIYIHLYDAKDVLSPEGERGMMDQIVAFEEQLHRP